MSPITSQVFALVCTQVAPLYCTRVLGAEAVEPLETMVTPEPWVIVVWPAPVWAMFKIVPTGKATDELGGMVKVLADALLIVTSVLLPSPRTAVYEADWALTLIVGETALFVSSETAIRVLLLSQ